MRPSAPCMLTEDTLSDRVPHTHTTSHRDNKHKKVSKSEEIFLFCIRPQQRPLILISEKRAEQRRAMSACCKNLTEDGLGF